MAQPLTMSRPDWHGAADAPLPAPSRHVMHVLPGFGIGGIQVRLVRIVNALGPRFRHTILSLNGDVSCRERIDPTVDVTVEQAVPHGNLVTRLKTNADRIRATAPDL